MWFVPYIKSIVLLTVFRTLFYQFLLITIGLTLGFVLNAEYVGWKSHMISRSFVNIFYPIQYNDDINQNLKNWGAFKMWVQYGSPPDFKIIEHAIAAEEFYWAKFSYTNEQGKTVTQIDNSRLRWKPWEYYYEEPSEVTKNELEDYLQNGSLNGEETDKAIRLRNEKMYQTNPKESTNAKKKFSTNR